MRAAIIIASTSAYKGYREDKCGPTIQRMLKQVSFEIKFMKVLPDDKRILSEVMKKLADNNLVDLIITAGGTGISKDDYTPEATLAILDRQLPGIPEAMRTYGMRFTKRTMLTREVAGIRKDTLIVNLPGSPKSAKECMEYVLPEVVHAVEVLRGDVEE